MNIDIDKIINEKTILVLIAVLIFLTIFFEYQEDRLREQFPIASEVVRLKDNHHGFITGSNGMGNCVFVEIKKYVDCYKEHEIKMVRL